MSESVTYSNLMALLNQSYNWQYLDFKASQGVEWLDQ